MINQLPVSDIGWQHGSPDMFDNFYLVKNHKPLKVEKEWNSALYKNVNNCLNNHIYPNLETSGGQSSNLYLNVVHFFNTSVNKTTVAALLSNMHCSISASLEYLDF
jgi:hypothetical protein